MMRWLKLLVSAAVLFVLFSVSQQTVLACSGLGSSITDLIDDSSVIVKAKAISIDETGQNGIIQVESYLKGGAGSTHLLLIQTPPVEIASLTENPYRSGSCNSLARTLNRGETTYFLLRRNDDGSYSLVARNLITESAFIFPTVASTITVVSPNFSFLTLTEAEFVAYIENYIGMPPAIPIPYTPLPRTAPILVRTTTNSAYIIPVDDGVAVKLTVNDPDPGRDRCAEPNCSAMSPNSRDWGRINEYGLIRFSANPNITFKGQSFLFSPTNDTVAVWQEGLILLYTLQNFRWGFYQALTLVNNAPVALTPYSDVVSSQWQADKAAFSPDGRMLAFSDQRGLWLWDVLSRNSEPRLLQSASSNKVVPYARYFSPRGRYLAVTEDDQQFTLDTVNGDRLPDGIVSPDERRLLTTVLDNRTPVVCLLGLWGCTLPTKTSPYIVRQMRWINARDYVMAICAGDDLKSCYINRYGQIISQNWGHGIFFDYDSVSDSNLVLRFNSLLEINGDYLEVRTQLDSDIVSAEWLPSLVYDPALVGDSLPTDGR